MIKKWLTLILAVSFLSACGGMGASEPVPAATPAQASSCMADEWSLEFHRTGGFAGFDEALALNSKGDLVVDSANPQTNFERTLSADEVMRITDLLKAACPFEPAPGSDNCADCFGYTLTVDTGGKTYRLEANDVTMTDEQSALTSALQGYFSAP